MKLFQRGKSLRDTANVIADAVAAAKDQEIEEEKMKLAEAKAAARVERVNLNMVIRGARAVSRTVDAIAREFDLNVQDMTREINGGSGRND